MKTLVFFQWKTTKKKQLYLWPSKHLLEYPRIFPLYKRASWIYNLFGRKFKKEMKRNFGQDLRLLNQFPTNFLWVKDANDYMQKMLHFFREKYLMYMTLNTSNKYCFGYIFYKMPRMILDYFGSQCWYVACFSLPLYSTCLVSENNIICRI